MLRSHVGLLFKKPLYKMYMWCAYACFLRLVTAPYGLLQAVVTTSAPAPSAPPIASAPPPPSDPVIDDVCRQMEGWSLMKLQVTDTTCMHAG
jgi:hypothetical protein